MTNLKNFFNKISNNNRIYTAEDIGEMSNNEFARNEKALIIRRRIWEYREGVI